jgi:hypothetical protein
MRAAATILSLLLVACGDRPSTAETPTDTGYPGVLVPTDRIEGGFLARQKVIARHAGRTSSFDAVLQFFDGTLTLIGLTPFGTRAYVLQQRGTDVTFDVSVPNAVEAMPFPPRYVLLDVHRTFFMRVPGAPLSDGEHRTERAGEIIVEHWQGGRLRERSFRRLSGSPEGVIRVLYGAGMVVGEIPTTIELHNGWFGYHLTIETVSYQTLPETRSAEGGSPPSTEGRHMRGGDPG